MANYNKNNNKNNKKNRKQQYDKNMNKFYNEALGKSSKIRKKNYTVMSKVI
jgi:hypothetical protein